MLPELEAAYIGRGGMYPCFTSDRAGREDPSVDTFIDPSLSVDGDLGTLAGLNVGDCQRDPEEGRGGSGSGTSS